MKINLNNINELINFLDCDVPYYIKENPKTLEYIKEWSKDLPKELNRKEIKNLSEVERTERNKKVNKIKHDIRRRETSKQDFMDKFDISIGIITEKDPEYKEKLDGAIRAHAENIIVKMCDKLFIFNNEEKKQLRKSRKIFLEASKQGITQGIKEFQN